VAGLILGPTVLGHLAPTFTAALFPASGPGAVAFQGFTSFSIAIFLLVAGMEVDLSMVWKQGRAAVRVGAGGMLLPFFTGLATARFAPGLLGRDEGADPQVFELFVATAMSISALPVIVRTLMDLHLYKSDLGMTILSAAILNDVTGWIVFALILGMAGTVSPVAFSIGTTIGLVLGYTLFVLTIGRWLIHRALLWIQALTHGHGGVLGFALSLGMFGAAFTEWAGVHALFGSFLVGVAIGDSPRLRESTRTVIRDFTSFLFAPLFFASIGLKLDFLAHFHLATVATVLAIGCFGKVAGCGFAARLGGMPAREAWAVGIAMNVRGAMEIILGLLALQAGIIGERLFVALVFMALVTSMIGGPLIQRILKRRRPHRLLAFLGSQSFLAPLRAASRQEAIRALSRSLAGPLRLDPEVVEAEVWKRELITPTGLPDGIAVPHARIAGITSPAVAVGISKDGIDFDSQDGLPAHLVFLLLTPEQENTAQLELLTDISRIFGSEDTRKRVLETTHYLEFVATVKELAPISA
jgi:Kef-type K+ transport system membrane component KefB/mannitol/fructose-specific phosphotransferase system IIA component (Ntr-type)